MTLPSLLNPVPAVALGIRPLQVRDVPGLSALPTAMTGPPTQTYGASTGSLPVGQLGSLIVVRATGGTFTVTYSAQTTSAITASGLTAATLQTAITGLSSVGAGNATVVGGSGYFLCTFTGTLAGTAFVVTLGTGSLTGGSATIGQPSLVGMDYPNNFTFTGPPGVLTLAGAVRGMTQGIYTSQTTNSPWAFEFDWDTVQGEFGFVLTGDSAGGANVLINGQYVTPYGSQPVLRSATSDGSFHLCKITGLAKGTYRVKVELESATKIFGVYKGPYDTFRPTKKPGLRLVALGDSFTEPTIVADNFGTPLWKYGGWVTQLAQFLGVDGWACGLGGTGYLAAPTLLTITATSGNFTVTYGGQTATIAYNASIATAQTALQALSSIGAGNCVVSGSAGALTINLTGTLAGQQFSCTVGQGTLSGGTVAITNSKIKARDRIATDLIPYAPDIVIHANGLNDYANYTTAAIQAEALTLFQQIRAALPNCLQVVTSGFYPKGHPVYPSALLAMRDALRTSAAAVPGTIFLDCLSFPVASPQPSGTLQAGASAGATTISCDKTFHTGTLLQIGTGALSEIRAVASTPTGTGPYTITISDSGQNLANTHIAGETVVEVGDGMVTGTGTGSSPTSSGTSTRYTGTDATHPTMDGHLNIAKTIHALLVAQLAA